jgi:hypothetical protein
MDPEDWAWVDPPEDYNYEEDAEFLESLENDELWATVPEPVLN